MATRWINLGNLALIALLAVSIPAAIFHFSQGRYPNAIMAIAAFLAGLLLLTVSRFQKSEPVPQPEPQYQSPSVPTRPTTARQEMPREPSGRMIGWLPLGFISGFVATGVMALVLMLGYGAALVLGNPDGSMLTRAIWALAHNPITETTQILLPIAIILHFVAGLAWAVVYAGLIEPNLKGPGWRRGLVFALIPWVASLVVFLPLMGGGPLGVSLGAGVLPILGNLVLHAAYGLTLGQFYASERILAESDTIEEGEIREMANAERWIAAGIIPGLVFGGLIGFVVGGLVMPGAQPLLVGVFGAILGSAVGALLGSFAGLQPGSANQ